MECMQVYLCGIQYYTLYFYTFKHLLLNPFFFPVSHLKIFSTIYSPQHCFSRLSRARFNFLNLSIHSFPFFFFLVPEISLLLSFLCSLFFSFYSWIKTRIHGFVWLSLFLRLFTYCFIFLYFIIISCPTSLTWQFKLLPLR